ncbi:MAG: hypothetical protein KJ050_04155 [Candidatus Omnitrophica bacterium]|nr:MAG: hypothetical protein UZ16_OP3001003163 [Candidatus Hinthialibacteria bacterium OLB16]MBE7487073.1 hypothetical protein [bacterium]MBK7494358.1 hypothetical protein [Candidatus Omnitrophota bacterium]MCE7909916.1 hypothetical protein [Candidatus Omnitrophica bacterium COP1]MBV6481142.1 hypothetical protein [bacterium]
MRFRDLLPAFQPRPVGRVVQADWDAGEHGVRFTIRFEPSGRTLNGLCRAGADPVSGAYLSEADLRGKIPQIRNLEIYEDPAGGDPNTLSSDDFRKMKIRFSLSNLSLSYQSTSPAPDTNTFISRILRR